MGDYDGSAAAQFTRIQYWLINIVGTIYISLLTFLMFGALLFGIGRFLSFIVLRLFNPKISRRVVVRVISGTVMSSFFLYALIATRSLPGRIVRFGLGSGLVKQVMEDRVEDLF